jgi:prepilin-type N-terminal cleavage/methylation domain-containing protein
MRRRAFTFVEMAVTLALFAVLAAAVVLSLARYQQPVLLQDVVDRIVSADRVARQRAREGKSYQQIVFDRAGGRWHDSRGGGKLPPGYQLLEVWVDGQAAADSSVVISYAFSGRSPSYALRLAAPAGGQRWLVLTGLTGQAVVLKEERDVRQIMAL